MTQGKGFAVHPGWQIMLKDAGISVANVLRRAGLPEDLFSREGAMLNSEEYFALWRGIEDEAQDPIFPLTIASHISVEAFSPPIFAALCSPDLNTALTRIARYKKLVMPMTLVVERTQKSTSLELRWDLIIIDPPASLVAGELVFFVALARMATREEIRPLKIITPNPPAPAQKYADYFGVEVQGGPIHQITFSAADAKRPFLTANEEMWRFFEPNLRKRLAELDGSATFSERVQSALLEMLPSGSASMNAVSAKLHLSPRTLQRRLSDEGGSFQMVLNQTREELARHYLGNSAMSGAEISFLLGFDDPNSFFRAFHQWTGQTPEQAREAMRQ